MQVVFQTSTYGRFGHLVMAVIPVVITLLAGAALTFGVIPFNDLWAWLATLSLFLAFAWCSIYCICFACERGKRIICSREQLIYRGLINTTAIPWSEITEFWIDFSNKTPFVFLALRTNLRKLPYRINMSGLQPTYATLFGLVRRMAPNAKAWTPVEYELVESSQDGLERACLEYIVDNPLILRSTRTPQKQGRMG